MLPEWASAKERDTDSQDQSTEVGTLPGRSLPSQDTFLQRTVLTNASIQSVEEKAVS